MAETFFSSRYFPGSYFGEGYWRASQNVGASFGDTAATLSGAVTVLAGAAAFADIGSDIIGSATLSADTATEAPSDTGSGNGGGGGLSFGQGFTPRAPQYADAVAFMPCAAAINSQLTAMAPAASMLFGKSAISALATIDDGMLQSDNAFWLLAA